VERLLQTIKLGVVPPGDRLPPERELAAQLHVSRVTLREAIRALQHAGYVQSRRGRYGGTFVHDRPPRPSRTAVRRLARRMGPALEDALTMRHVLETGAAEAAALAKGDPPARTDLRRRLGDTSAADAASYRRMDSRLHLTIAEVSSCPSLTAAVADVRMRLDELLDAIPLIERNLRHSDEQHGRIVAAILEGDAERARAAMAEHVAGTAALLRGFLT
jgi:DNA-binding FadR family transcriptional regulator